MEANGGPSSRQRRQLSADRFLTLLSQSPPSDGGDELSEDDVFWNEESAESSDQLSRSFSLTSTAPPGTLSNHSPANGFGRPENFGILAALPEMNNRRSIFNHMTSSVAASPASAKALSSSSSASMIPVIPRPPVERTLSASLKYQSAPMNVPVMMRNDFDRHGKGRLLEENDDLEEAEDEEGEMLPPHEIVAKQSVMSPILSSSVLEGAGRTLKGRDLRQVRNAVFRQTDGPPQGKRKVQLFNSLFSTGAAASCSPYNGSSSVHCSFAMFMVLASASMELGWSISIEGSVSCSDCSSSYDYSGISISLKCDQMKKPAVAITNRDGSFEAKFPSSHCSLGNCKARFLGGPKQLYALNKDMVSKLIRVGDQGNTYTTSNTLTFASSCSTLTKLGKCSASLSSSKTIDFPFPPEYGLPPSSYYLTPFLPIIGIP